MRKKEDSSFSEEKEAKRLLSPRLWSLMKSHGNKSLLLVFFRKEDLSSL